MVKTTTFLRPYSVFQQGSTTLSDTCQPINLADLCQIAWLLSEAEVLTSCRVTALYPRPYFDKLSNQRARGFTASLINLGVVDVCYLPSPSGEGTCLKTRIKTTSRP